MSLHDGLLEYEWFLGNDSGTTGILNCDFWSRDERAVIKDVSDAGSLVGGNTITIAIIIVHYVI